MASSEAPHDPAPSPPTGARRDGADIVLSVEQLVVDFPAGNGGPPVQAVSGISFDIAAGETLGLVGESGCGKSSAARAILQLPPPTSGVVTFEGRELSAMTARQRRALRGRLQMIFQDPISSLNPRRPVRAIVGEPLVVAGHHGDHRARVDELLRTVGIDPELGGRRPHQFSGGQCQRISVARALITEPRLLVCDEPVSALDVSIQAQILNLLEDLKDRYGLTMLFISHDLSVVVNISDRVAVMYLGKLCELGATTAVFRRPAHPYSRALLDAVPSADPARRLAPRHGLAGELPSPSAPPSGCRFRTRCPRATPRCAEEEPALRPVGDDHAVACHFPLLDDAAPTAAPPPLGQTSPG
ncbi:MAG: ATP-binding cassette domain-containing protein [Acidimicrobiales bacterium]|nr:ATP-binding cassette domain-containing protein [Acidimicrobiales bacterium]